MKLSNKFWIQVTTLILLGCTTAILINNLTINLIRNQMGLSFSWLVQPAGFALAEHPLPYNPSSTYAWALFIGWLNSLKVILSGLLIATILGILAGAASISRNYLLRLIASTYVTLIRQIPLLLQLMFWYFVGFLSLSETPLSLLGSILQFSNQGINVLGIQLSVEFSALLVGLSVFTGASIAELIRGGLNSVPKGQWEAYRSLGISEGLGLRQIVLPQALPAIIPGLTSQYLNLAKNSTLAIAVGYSDIYAVGDTTITQTGRAIEGFLLLMMSFLFLNIVISGSMEVINKLALRSQYHLR